MNVEAPVTFGGGGLSGTRFRAVSSRRPAANKQHETHDEKQDKRKQQRNPAVDDVGGRTLHRVTP
jgi:hypothetical protein